MTASTGIGGGGRLKDGGGRGWRGEGEDYGVTSDPLTKRGKDKVHAVNCDWTQ